jgi:dihydrofolate synthase/folylpolyglutamate synthase
MLAMEVMREILGQEAKPMLWRQVLREVVWEGRMEEISPDFYVDGAHNPSAMRGFVESVARCNRSHCILFSAVEDKDYAQMIEILCKGLSTDFYLVVPMRERRAASGILLQATFQSYTDKPVYLAKSLEDAFALLRTIRGERVVYAVGSLYFTGMIKQYRNEKEARDAEL